MIRELSFPYLPIIGEVKKFVNFSLSSSRRRTHTVNSGMSSRKSSDNSEESCFSRKLLPLLPIQIVYVGLLAVCVCVPCHEIQQQHLKTKRGKKMKKWVKLC
jgi:hypothetical protein